MKGQFIECYLARDNLLNITNISIRYYEYNQYIHNKYYSFRGSWHPVGRCRSHSNFFLLLLMIICNMHALLAVCPVTGIRTIFRAATLCNIIMGVCEIINTLGFKVNISCSKKAQLLIEVRCRTTNLNFIRVKY